MRHLPFPATLLALACGALCLLTEPAEAGDWNRGDDPMLDAVGLHAGKIGGVGLAFKFPLQWWLYGQAAGGIWHTGGDRRHNLGFELQYILRQDSKVRVYFGAGLGYFYHREETSLPDGSSVNTTSKNWNAGFGVGLELLRGERWSFQIEGDFTHESDDDSFIFFPQAGIFYYF